uniref:C2H2-type domain-containing protein n=1 Tax=Nelumbo nucifera TaxID=4432 RepID=A0A822YHB6_NELNU|nr:TPA_asm: hypothetical protein HUJ06_012435 [Nelumbo nucifera]
MNERRTNEIWSTLSTPIEHSPATVIAGGSRPSTCIPTSNSTAHGLNSVKDDDQSLTEDPKRLRGLQFIILSKELAISTTTKEVIPISSTVYEGVKRRRDINLNAEPSEDMLLDTNSSSPLSSPSRRHLAEAFSENLTTISQLSPYASLSVGNQVESSPAFSVSTHQPGVYQQAFHRISVAAPWTPYNDLYECTRCHKIFRSGRALGGHMSSHAKARKRESMLIDSP